nr:putative integron gene cassette protein [uncultured bacterium]
MQIGCRFVFFVNSDSLLVSFTVGFRSTPVFVVCLPGLFVFPKQTMI